jgi:hypothetical protein
VLNLQAELPAAPPPPPPTATAEEKAAAKSEWTAEDLKDLVSKLAGTQLTPFTQLY